MTSSTVQRAEALLRSLVGITAAEVRMSPGGRLEVVRVATASALSNGQVVQNVRSALFAGLGVRIDPAQIELVDTSAWVTAAVPAGDVEPEVEPAPPAEPLPVQPQAAKNGDGGPGASNGAGNGRGSKGGVPEQDMGGVAHHDAPVAAPLPAGRDAVVAQRLAVRPAAPTNGHGRIPTSAPKNGNGSSVSPANGANGAARPAAVAEAAQPHVHALQVESVELLHQAGRIRCRVALVAGQQRYTAVADAAADTVPEFQLAARVTCDTVRAAQLSSAHLDGATLACMAGRTHVVVALSEWKSGNQLVSLTGSAVVTDRLELAAAVAVLQALRGHN